MKLAIAKLPEFWRGITRNRDIERSAREWMEGYDAALAYCAEKLDQALSHAAGQEADKPMTADMAKALPGGNLDDSTFQYIEEALDAAEAPMRGADGKWLTLPERIRALSRGVPEGK